VNPGIWPSETACSLFHLRMMARKGDGGIISDSEGL